MAKGRGQEGAALLRQQKEEHVSPSQRQARVSLGKDIAEGGAPASSVRGRLISFPGRR